MSKRLIVDNLFFEEIQEELKEQSALTIKRKIKETLATNTSFFNDSRDPEIILKEHAENTNRILF